jgi:hypothetical protein
MAASCLAALGGQSQRRGAEDAFSHGRAGDEATEGWTRGSLAPPLGGVGRDLIFPVLLPSSSG